MTVGATAVFVYGTLRPGGPNHDLVARAVTHLVPAHAPGLRLLAAAHGGFPFVTPTSPADATCGTLLLLAPDAAAAALARLDQLEGYDPRRPDHGHYLRRRRPVVTDTDSIFGPPGTRLPAWTYLAGPAVPVGHLEPVPGNDWDLYRPTGPGRTRPCVASSA